MATYLLVHGGFQGGWAYRRVARLLRGAGHEVYTPTLTALGERSHLAYVQVNLDTHVADIGNVILWEDLEDVILVGHSYGGIVVTGVADRMPERIAALVYLDALVPADGDSLFKLRPDYLARFIAKAADSGGLAIAPGAASAFDTRLPADWAWIDAKTTPHPLACFTQAIRLTGRAARVARRFYVYAEGGVCDGLYDRFRGERGAHVIGLPRSGHSIMIDQPEALADILNAIPVI